MKWNDSFKKLFFDYHNFAENPDLAKNFDAVQFAEKLQQVGCEMVSVFAICGRGYKYYQKGKFGTVHPMLPKGLDMVEEVIRECHKRNIKVLGYVAHSISREVLTNEHPEFIACSEPNVYENKGFTDISPCKINESNDYINECVKELVQNYDLDCIFLDGSYNNKPCYCEHCMTKFKNDTGFDIPMSREDEHWKNYINWYQHEMERCRAEFRQTVHSIKPNLDTIINWNYSYRSPDKVPEDLGYLFSDVPFPNEMEGIDICTRSYALAEKKFEIHNTAFLKHWGEWGLKHTNVLKRCAALLLANGTNVHIGYQFHPEFYVENGVWNAFKEVFDWVDEYKEFVTNNEIKPYIGAYYANVQSGLTHTGDIWSEPMWLYGLNKLMIDSGLHYSMLGAEYMKRTINDFSAVILPDMRYISDEEVEIITQYVKNGGTIIATGLVGTMDKMGKYSGNSKLCELLGIEWNGLFDDPYSYLKITDETLAKNTSDMKLTMEAPTALVKPTTAKSLATIYDLYKRTDGKYAHRYSPFGKDTGFAGVTINKVGKGNAIFFANEICLAYYKTFQWNLIEMIHNILFDIVKIDKRVYATGDGAVELTLAKRNDATQVHIVNMLGTLPSVQCTVPACMPKEIYEISDLKVVAIHDKVPTKVVMQPQNIEIPFKSDGNKVEFTVPKVGLYEIIEIY